MKSCTLATGAASLFVVASALVSFVPDRAPADLESRWGLRGAIVPAALADVVAGPQKALAKR